MSEIRRRAIIFAIGRGWFGCAAWLCDLAAERARDYGEAYTYRRMAESLR